MEEVSGIFDYEALWGEEEKNKERKIQREIIPNLPKGKPRKGVNITKRFRVLKK